MNARAGKESMDPKRSEQPDAIEMSPDVIGTIVRRAALEVPGVVRLLPRRSPSAVDRVLRGGHEQDVTLTLDQGVVTVELALLVSAPHNVVGVAQAVQVAVKQAVERLAGLQVAAVHVRVEDVVFSTGDVA